MGERLYGAKCMRCACIRHDGEAASIGAVLDQGPEMFETYVHSPLVPQLDLIAMKAGFVMASEPWDEHPDEWTWATFTKANHIGTATDG